MHNEPLDGMMPLPFVRALAAAGMIVLGIGIIGLLAFLIPYMHHLAARY